jgi:hypothetical protein
MYELLIRIETVCVGAPLLTLLGVGIICTVVGLLLWLAGTYFSSVIVGVLGAAIGSFCGLLISQWFDVNSLVSMGIGAAIFCIAAVLLKNIIIIVLAMIVFALVGGAAYSSVILGKPAQEPDSQLTPVPASSFSHMDSTLRLSYVEQISDEQDGFFEKIKTLLKDTLGIMSPYKWKLLLSTLVGGLGGLLLVWIIKKFVLALCSSVVGAFLVLVGIESLLVAVGFQMCNAFEGHRRALTVTYAPMAAVGTVVQLILGKSQKPKETEAEKQ